MKKRERERVRKRERERKRDVGYGCFIFIFIFKRNDRCLVNYLKISVFEEEPFVALYADQVRVF
jgi:hypothetical protein